MSVSDAVLLGHDLIDALLLADDCVVARANDLLGDDPNARAGFVRAFAEACSECFAEATRHAIQQAITAMLNGANPESTRFESLR